MKTTFESVMIQGTPMHRIGDAFYESHEWGMWAIQNWNATWKAWERWNEFLYSSKAGAEAEKARLDAELEMETRFRIVYTGAAA